MAYAWYFLPAWYTWRMSLVARVPAARQARVGSMAPFRTRPQVQEMWLEIVGDVIFGVETSATEQRRNGRVDRGPDPDAGKLQQLPSFLRDSSAPE